MKYNFLGDTGLRVSELCLGAMTFGESFFNIGAVDQKGADEMVEVSLDAGVNFFDTADVYSRGESERILGKALDHAGVSREKVVVATKVRGAMSDAAQEGVGDVNNVGLSRKHIVASCENSLRRLDTDYIDLYQIHGLDPRTDWYEIMRALDDLVRDGKVRYVGCSNLAVRHILRANGIATTYGLSPFVSLQAYYSLAGRELEHELLPLCIEEGIGTMIWSPLAGGFLTGKFRRGEEGPENARRSEFDFPPIDKERAYDIVDVLDEIADEKGVTIARLALAWLLHQEGVSTVIIGARRMEQLEDNLKAPDIELTDDELERIGEVSDAGTPYPQWMIGFQTGRDGR